jgi:hypothetical protein
MDDYVDPDLFFDVLPEPYCTIDEVVSEVISGAWNQLRDRAAAPTVGRYRRGVPAVGAADEGTTLQVRRGELHNEAAENGSLVGMSTGASATGAAVSALSAARCPQAASDGGAGFRDYIVLGTDAGEVLFLDRSARTAAAPAARITAFRCLRADDRVASLQPAVSAAVADHALVGLLTAEPTGLQAAVATLSAVAAAAAAAAESAAAAANAAASVAGAAPVSSGGGSSSRPGTGSGGRGGGGEATTALGSASAGAAPALVLSLGDAGTGTAAARARGSLLFQGGVVALPPETLPPSGDHYNERRWAEPPKATPEAAEAPAAGRTKAGGATKARGKVAFAAEEEEDAAEGGGAGPRLGAGPSRKLVPTILWPADAGERGFLLAAAGTATAIATPAYGAPESPRLSPRAGAAAAPPPPASDSAAGEAGGPGGKPPIAPKAAQAALASPAAKAAGKTGPAGRAAPAADVGAGKERAARGIPAGGAPTEAANEATVAAGAVATSPRAPGGDASPAVAPPALPVTTVGLVPLPPTGVIRIFHVPRQALDAGGAMYSVPGGGAAGARGAVRRLLQVATPPPAAAPAAPAPSRGCRLCASWPRSRCLWV